MSYILKNKHVEFENGWKVIQESVLDFVEKMLLQFGFNKYEVDLSIEKFLDIERFFSILVGCYASKRSSWIWKAWVLLVIDVM